MHKYRERLKAEAKKRRQLILRLRAENRTLADIAQLLGISAQRVYQLEQQEKTGSAQQ